MFFSLGILCSVPSIARALIVTEIMYDAPGTDTGREWIEVYNETTDVIKLTDWKLFESNSSHGISAARGDGILSVGEYAVVASAGIASVSDYPNYTGDVYDSSFSLNNAGESFSFKTPSGSFVAEVIYVGGVLATGDSNSLHWIGSQWTSRTPNPGADPANASDAGQVTSSQNTTGSNSNSSSGFTQSGVNMGVSTKSATLVPIYTMSVVTKPAQPIARSPFVVTPKVVRTLGEESKEYTFGIVRVVTGDGRQLIGTKIEPIQLVYTRAGTYRLIVEYTQSNLSTTPLARYSIDITVVDPTIAIGRDGSAITLTNESDIEVDVSQYIIRGGGRMLVLAPGTVVLPDATISIGGSQDILAARPKVIELISADGVSKVSAREFIVTNNTYATPVKPKVHRSAYESAAISTPIHETSIVTPITSMPVSSTLFASARDKSLVSYNDTAFVETVVQEQKESSQARLTERAIDEAIEEDTISVDRLLFIAFVALSVIAVSVTYVYIQSEESNSEESVISAKASEHHLELDTVEDYVIIER